MGNRIAPPKFILFVVLLAAVGIGAGRYADWLHATMIGFDIAAAVFLLSCIPLLFDSKAEAMRRHAAENDANRAVLLGITAAVTSVVLVTVGAELLQSQSRSGSGDRADRRHAGFGLAVQQRRLRAPLCAHVLSRDGKSGGDSGGLDIPGTREPDYRDFVYFSFTLGMTFQTSDAAITGGGYPPRGDLPLPRRLRVQHRRARLHHQRARRLDRRFYIGDRRRGGAWRR